MAWKLRKNPATSIEYGDRSAIIYRGRSQTTNSTMLRLLRRTNTLRRPGAGASPWSTSEGPAVRRPFDTKAADWQTERSSDAHTPGSRHRTKVSEAAVKELLLVYRLFRLAVSVMSSPQETPH